MHVSQPINAEKVLLYIYLMVVLKKQILQAANTELFNLLGIKAHIVCVKICFLYKLRQQMSVKS